MHSIILIKYNLFKSNLSYVQNTSSPRSMLLVHLEHPSARDSCNDSFIIYIEIGVLY